MGRGYTDVTREDSQRQDLEAFNQVTGAKLIGVRLPDPDDYWSYQLVFDNGKTLELEGHYDDQYVASVLVHELAHARRADECDAESAVANYLQRVGKAGSKHLYDHPIYRRCQVPRGER